ncbi:hypothetical protein ACFRAI_39690 [Streptomyces sp. NPDC056637]|uniref:hypothetical protein n=1 Tax=unclassified Streptomyces TaxID=2593676 RepID=UPI003628331D
MAARIGYSPMAHSITHLDAGDDVDGKGPASVKRPDMSDVVPAAVPSLNRASPRHPQPPHSAWTAHRRPPTAPGSRLLPCAQAPMPTDDTGA